MANRSSARVESKFPGNKNDSAEWEAKRRAKGEQIGSGKKKERSNGDR